MRLKNVAKSFDKVVAFDAYSASTRLKCQIEPLDLYRMDGTRVKMRGMDTGPRVQIPERRAIRIDDQVFLVSEASSDYWQGEAIRSRYVIQGADDIAHIQTIAQALADTPGTTAFASIDFNKYSTDERDSSDYHPQYHIFLGPDEPAHEDTIISTPDRSYLVRNSHKTTAGLRDALANVIDAPFFDAAQFTSRTYNPVTDTYGVTASSVRCIRLRWQEHFMYLSESSEKFERGDMMVLLPQNLVVKSGDRLTLSDGAWEARAVVSHADYKQVQVRRAL